MDNVGEDSWRPPQRGSRNRTKRERERGNGTYRGGNYSNKPGWADYVSDVYKDSRDIGKMWRNAGKPRQGQIFELYRDSKSICKYAIRYIKRHENSLRK